MSIKKNKITSLVKYKNCCIFILAALYFFTDSERGLCLEVNFNQKLEDGKNANIIMISINNLGAEHMSLYGYQRETTPNIDKFSKDALVFLDHFSVCSWTLPAAASLFTSQYPYTHKLMDRRTNNHLEHQKLTLPKILKIYGYKTAAFTAGLDYGGTWGFSDGFDIYDTTNHDLGSFNEVIPKAKEWLKNNKNSKFFLLIQGYDVHGPFTPPDKFKNKFSDRNYKSDIDLTQFIRGFETSENQNKYTAYYVYPRTNIPSVKVELSENDIEYLRDLYDEEVLFVDEIIGSFLDYLEKENLFKDTIIILFSEHGEMFARHGRFGRVGPVRGTFYDDTLHAPLIMKFPSIKGKKVKGICQITDILPTILDWLNIPKSSQFQGKSLLPLIERRDQVHNYAFAGSFFNRQHFVLYPEYSEMQMIRSRIWKLIHEIIMNDDGSIKEENFELYNLKSDPNEMCNLIKERRRNQGYIVNKFNELKNKLSLWEKETKTISSEISTVSVSDELLNAAYKHGYW